MPRSILYISLFFVLSFPALVASRCKGEASFAVGQCACTVKNRLDAGWVKGKVLSAFYAPDVQATNLEIDAVAAVLDGTARCDPRLYFMYSKADTIHLGIDHLTPVLSVKSENKEVRFYERWFRRG